MDLDQGNYERFMDVTLHRDNIITTGKIYQHVIEKERRGDYLRKTVQGAGGGGGGEGFKSRCLFGFYQESSIALPSFSPAHTHNGTPRDGCCSGLGGEGGTDCCRKGQQQTGCLRH